MDDLDTPFFLMRALAGPMMFVVSALVMMTIFAPVVLYVIARWRAHRDPSLDPQLGLKFALHYFSISAFQLALAAATLLVWALISNAPSSFKGNFYRVAFGMLVPAGLVLAAHVSLLRRTNDTFYPGVRRLFTGYNLIVTGLLGFIALIMGFQALFAKGSSGDLGRVAGAMVLVYGTAWGVIGYKFGQLVVGDGPGPAPTMYPPPPPPAPVPVAPTPGLPPLGEGAYPPIESK